MNVDEPETSVDRSMSAICRFCIEEVPNSATKCRACGSHLTWRRHLILPGIFISLFLGIIATSGIVYKPISYTLKPEFEVNLYKISSDESGYYFYLKNKGRSTFILSQVEAYIGADRVILEVNEQRSRLSYDEDKILYLTVPPDYKPELKFRSDLKAVERTYPGLAMGGKFDFREVSASFPEEPDRCELKFTFLTKTLNHERVLAETSVKEIQVYYNQPKSKVSLCTSDFVNFILNRP